VPIGRESETSLCAPDVASASARQHGGTSMSPHLRMYPQPDETEALQPASVRVSLGDLLPIIAFAQRRNYLWLQDFLDDEVAITPDLYQALHSFRGGCRPSA